VYETLGFSWATSLLAFLTVAMAPFPYVGSSFGRASLATSPADGDRYLFFTYGKRIRQHSKYASET
jgi:hypothetical protein